MKTMKTTTIEWIAKMSWISTVTTLETGRTMTKDRMTKGQTKSSRMKGKSTTSSNQEIWKTISLIRGILRSLALISLKDSFWISQSTYLWIQLCQGDKEKHRNGEEGLRK